MLAVTEEGPGVFVTDVAHLYRRHGAQTTATAEWAETRPARLAEMRAAVLARHEGRAAA